MKKRCLRTWLIMLCVGLVCPCLLWLTSCRQPEPVEKNAVTAVRLSGDTLTVEACLTDGFLASTANQDRKVYLFELPSYLSVDAELSGLRPVAEVKSNTRIRFTLSATDGMRSRLYSSYLVASYDSATKRYTALTPPMALQNPEANASITSTYTPSGSIKGLVNAAPADAIRLGAAHAVVDVSIGELMLPAWEPGAEPYVWNGTTAYVDGDSLAALDTAVSTYAAAGVQVYLRLRLTCLRLTEMKNPENTQNTANADRGATVQNRDSTVGENDAVSVNSPAAPAFEDAKPNAAGYAVDMTSPTVAVRMEGFLDYLAARYTAMTSETAPTVAFVIGYRTNDPAHNEAGDISPEATVTNYEKLVRVAYTALRTHAADGQVYLSLDDRRSVDETVGGWDVPQFLSAFAAEAALRGDYEWQVAAELSADSSRIWEEGESLGNHYTVRTIGTLTDLLGGSAYHTPGGEVRRLLISGFAIPATDNAGAVTDASMTDQAASYAYAHLIARQNGHIEALLYSAYTDIDDLPAGLWGAKEPAETVGPTIPDASEDTDKTAPSQEPEAVPASELYARPICEVFRKMDTTAAASLSDSLTALIGLPYSKLSSAMAGISEPVTLVEADGHASALTDTHEDAATLFRFDHGTQNGFTGTGNLTYAELAVSEFPERYYLHARYDRTTVTEPMPLTVTLPATALIGGKELVLDLFAGELDRLSTDGTPVALSVRLTRGAVGDPADGNGALLYEATVTGLNRDAWKTVTFPVEEWTSRLGAEDTVTLTLLLDAPTGESFELGLAGVYVTGPTAGASVLTIVVIVVVAVAALLTIAAVLYLNLRHRRRTGTNS